VDAIRNPGSDSHHDQAVTGSQTQADRPFLCSEIMLYGMIPYWSAKLRNNFQLRK